MTSAMSPTQMARIDALRRTAIEGGVMHPDSISAGGAMQVTEDRQSIIKEFEWAITDLQKTVEELHVRLAPITRVEPEGILTDVIAPTSEARSRLHDLQGTTASLRGLISRLEV